jgi:hypothetical protein
MTNGITTYVLRTIAFNAPKLYDIDPTESTVMNLAFTEIGLPENIPELEHEEKAKADKLYNRISKGADYYIKTVANRRRCIIFIYQMLKELECYGDDDKKLYNSILSHDVWSYIPLEIAMPLLDCDQLQNCREKRALLEKRNNQRGGELYALIVALAKQWINPTKLPGGLEYISPSVLFNVDELGKHFSPRIIKHAMTCKLKLDGLLTSDKEIYTKEFNELFRKKIIADAEYLREFAKIIKNTFETWLKESNIGSQKQTVIAQSKDLADKMDSNILQFETFYDIHFFRIIEEWCAALTILIS